MWVITFLTIAIPSCSFRQATIKQWSKFYTILHECIYIKLNENVYCHFKAFEARSTICVTA